MQKPLGTTAAATLLGAMLALSACHLPPPVYYVQERPRSLRVPEPPPQARLEVPPPQPDESYLWRDGYWAWDGSEYVWVAGEWTPPQAGYLFVAAAVAFSNGCWQYQPPYWCAESVCGGSVGPAQGGGHGGHGGGGQRAVIAHGPAVPVPPESARVRAPEVEESSARVRAPEAQAAAEPVRVRAPAVLDPKDPDADGPKPDVDSSKRLPAWQDDRYIKGRRPSVTLDDGASDAIEVVDDDPSPALRRRPEYLGTRAGRPVFGDDPDGVRPRVLLPEHRTDATGAIVLAEPRRMDGAVRSPSRRVIVVGSSDHSPIPRPGFRPVGRIHGPDTTVAPPELHRAPPPVIDRRPEPSYQPVHHAPSPVYRASSPAPVHHAPAPSYRHSAPAPSYRYSSPAPVHHAPAPSYRQSSPAPSYQHSAPSAPSRVSATVSVAAPSGRRHR